MEKECYEEEVQPYPKTDYKPIITFIIEPHKKVQNLNMIWYYVIENILLILVPFISLVYSPFFDGVGLHLSIHIYISFYLKILLYL